jgi:hypothetical protein
MYSIVINVFSVPLLIVSAASTFVAEKVIVSLTVKRIVLDNVTPVQSVVGDLTRFLYLNPEFRLISNNKLSLAPDSKVTCPDI